MITSENLAPYSPEASLRGCVNDIVFMFADPVNVEVHGELVEIEGRYVEMPPDHAHYYGDTIVQKTVGRAGVQILTQEFPNPELDQKLPHYISLRAQHQLGDVFVHITLPDYQDPHLAPTKEQKARPKISTVVESKTRTQFDRNFMLNELLSVPESPQEAELLSLIQALVLPVRTKPHKSQTMTETQMNLLEDYLTTLFWPGEKEDAVQSVDTTHRFVKVARHLASLISRLKN